MDRNIPPITCGVWLERQSEYYVGLSLAWLADEVRCPRAFAMPSNARSQATEAPLNSHTTQAADSGPILSPSGSVNEALLEIKEYAIRSFVTRTPYPPAGDSQGRLIIAG